MEMFRKNFIVGQCLILAFLSLASTVGTPQVDVEEVVEEVARRLKATSRQLPDFLCREKITLDAWRSHRRGSWSLEGAFEFRFSRRFGEERVPETEEDEKMIEKVLILGGVFPVLYSTFLSGPSEGRRFEGERQGDSYWLTFDVPVEESEVVLMLEGGDVKLGYKGKVKIDAESYQPLRLEWSVTTKTSRLHEAKHKLTYHPVQIGTNTFYLPKEQNLLLYYGNIWYRTKHTYDHYKHFTVQIP